MPSLPRSGVANGVAVATWRNRKARCSCLCPRFETRPSTLSCTGDTPTFGQTMEARRLFAKSVVPRVIEDVHFGLVGCCCNALVEGDTDLSQRCGRIIAPP